MATLTQPKTATIALPADLYDALLAYARRAGKTPDEAATNLVTESLTRVNDDEAKRREFERQSRILGELTAESQKLGLYSLPNPYAIAETEERQKEIERRDRIVDELVAETERLGLYDSRSGS